MANMEKDNQYYGSERPETYEFIPLECKKILDVGCGQGKYGEIIKDRNQAEVWGAELMEDQAKIAKKRLHKVLVGDFEANMKSLPDRYFDCVIFNDSLEHMKDHYKVLNDIKAKMVPGGYIAGSIPNFRYYRNIQEVLFRKEFQYVPAGILDYTHYRFFTEKSIRRTFAECGYEILTFKGINPDENRKLKLLNLLLFGFLKDMKFWQFGITAQVKS